MSNLQFQLHSQPSPFSSLSSLSSSSLKLFANHSFSPNSLPFNPPKPFSLRCRHSDLFDQNTLASSQRPTRPTASGTTYFSTTPFLCFFFFFLIAPTKLILIITKKTFGFLRNLITAWFSNLKIYFSTWKMNRKCFCAMSFVR